tara:strand:- start:3553 stop:5178 length:1626 start_codon:yes stop_codon:yes gene_type:complete
MYKPSQNMPLNSFQVVSPCENQTNFRAGQIIRFVIPRSIGYWDPHTSRLQLEVATENNNFKMCFAHSCGVASLIDMVRVSQNGIVLSETTEYATLNNLFTLYSDSLSIKQRNATQNGARDLVLGPNLGDGTLFPVYNQAGGAFGPLQRQQTTSGAILGECINGDGSLVMDRTSTKYQLEMRGVGIFELLNAVPSIAIGDILIEIRLVNFNKDALMVHPCSAIPLVGAAPGGGDTITLTPPFNGFSNLADSPFVTGMTVQVRDANGAGVAGSADQLITGMAQANNGNITITGAGSFGANASEALIISRGISVNGAAVSPTLTDNTAFVVSRASLLLQVVSPPQQYVQETANKVAQDGLVLDLNTYTTYRTSITAGINNVTCDIPAMMSRARGILSVPRLNNNNGEFSGYTPNNISKSNILGQYQQLLRYRTQIGELYYPNQPVQLDQMVKQSITHFSAQHIVELEKCLNACKIPMRSLLSTKQNFVIPRVLAKYGASVNLEKGIRLYLEYSGAGSTVPLDVVTYVNHINRVMISPMGLEVLS